MNNIIKNSLLLLFTSLLVINISSASSNELEVKISNNIGFIDVKHNGKEIRIQRNQSPK